MTHIIDNKIFFIGKRLGNSYVINLNDIDYEVKCFSSLVDSFCICYRRLGHANMRLI
jgi:hypothetical protein